MNRLGFLKALLALPFLPAWLRRPASGRPEDDIEAWLKSVYEKKGRVHGKDFLNGDKYDTNAWCWYCRGINDGLQEVLHEYLATLGREDEFWIIGDDGKIREIEKLEKAQGL